MFICELKKGVIVKLKRILNMYDLLTGNEKKLAFSGLRHEYISQICKRLKRVKNNCFIGYTYKRKEKKKVRSLKKWIK